MTNTSRLPVRAGILLTTLTVAACQSQRIDTSLKSPSSHTVASSVTRGAVKPSRSRQEPKHRSLANLAQPGYQKGHASFYARRFHGRRTASGERFNVNDLTAAHRTLPFGTKVRVTNGLTGANIEVRINDRGPFHRNRVIDLSPAAARSIGIFGVAPVVLEPLDLSTEMLSPTTAYGDKTPALSRVASLRTATLTHLPHKFTR